jgi:hypothetical protein
LIRAAVSGEIPADRTAPELAMNNKARFILAATMSSMMVAMVTLIVTGLNLGLHHDFILQWVKAYIIAWPVAAITGYLIMPMARRFTDRVVTRSGGVA